LNDTNSHIVGVVRTTLRKTAHSQTGNQRGQTHFFPIFWEIVRIFKNVLLFTPCTVRCGARMPCL